MKIAVIGAGPAGLTSAKQALERGHEVVVFEASQSVGGIWNPASYGAYPSVVMQSSRMSFPFSDFAPVSLSPFHRLDEVHAYLVAYADRFGVAPHVLFGRRVTRVARKAGGGRWRITAGDETHEADAVMVASGELWEPRRMAPLSGNGAAILTAKDYRGPDAFQGKAVLVVGGGVSGADIAAELGGADVEVDWSVRRKALFLPRSCGAHYNDELFSYVGRLAVEAMSYADYLALLETVVPEHIAACRRTGLLPADGMHGAIHVNDRIVPAVDAGEVGFRAATAAIEADGTVRFADGSTRNYDAVIQCLGYGLPNYSFLEGFSRTDLFEHFIYRLDPTLAIVNTPVDTEAFGTACPYFEAIAGWALRVFEGEYALPDAEAMAAWCREHMQTLDDRRYYDCWLETVRLGLMNRTLPDPTKRFSEYWKIVSGIVSPSRLCLGPLPEASAPLDNADRVEEIRLRILAALGNETCDALASAGEINGEDAERAARVPARFRLDPSLPYRQRETERGFEDRDAIAAAE